MSTTDYVKTKETIKATFPGEDDNSKELRHALYILVTTPAAKNPDSRATLAGMNLKDVMVGVVENSKAPAVENLTAAEKLAAVEKVLNTLQDDRFGSVSLAQLVTDIMNSFIGNPQSTWKHTVTVTLPNPEFSAHDVTEEARRIVNGASLQVLDDRDFEEIDLFGDGGPKANTQRIEHSEVRPLVQAAARTMGLERKPHPNGYYIYRKSTRNFVPVQLPAGAITNTAPNHDATRVLPDAVPTPVDAPVMRAKAYNSLLRDYFSQKQS